MATHSSILACRIPWTEEPGGLQPTGSQSQTGLKRLGAQVQGLAWGSDGEESACDAGDLGSVPGLERSAGEGKGRPLQYSCLGNSMDRGAW